MYDWLPRWIFTASNFTTVSDDSRFYPIRAPRSNDPKMPTCGEYGKKFRYCIVRLCRKFQSIYHRMHIHDLHL